MPVMGEISTVFACYIERVCVEPGKPSGQGIEWARPWCYRDNSPTLDAPARVFVEQR